MCVCVCVCVCMYVCACMCVRECNLSALWLGNVHACVGGGGGEVHALIRSQGGGGEVHALIRSQGGGG